MTFEEVAKQWEMFSQSSSGSIRQHSEHFNIRFKDLKDKPIQNITKADLITWRIWLQSQPYATKTKNTTITYVKAVFKFAYDMYDIPNIASCLTRLKKTDDEVLEEFDVWTPDEFELFDEAIQNTEYKLFFEFLYWTGCRRGEAIALQRKDLHDGVAEIKYSQRDRTTGLRPTKTKQRRKVQLDNQLWTDVDAYMEKTEGKYLFGGDVGLAPTSIDRCFKRAIRDSGVNEIRLHDLRHSHATWLINNGTNIVAVSKRLGHNSIEQTLSTYTHLLESSDQNMMAKLNEYKKPTASVQR